VPFTWGDEVRVRSTAPAVARPGALAAVVAITVIDGEALATAYGAELGRTVYLVEFGDGSSTHVAEEHLEPVGADGAPV